MEPERDKRYQKIQTHVILDVESKWRNGNFKQPEKPCTFINGSNFFGNFVPKSHFCAERVTLDPKSPFSAERGTFVQKSKFADFRRYRDFHKTLLGRVLDFFFPQNAFSDVFESKKKSI